MVLDDTFALSDEIEAIFAPCGMTIDLEICLGISFLRLLNNAVLVFWFNFNSFGFKIESSSYGGNFELLLHLVLVQAWHGP